MQSAMIQGVVKHKPSSPIQPLIPTVETTGTEIQLTNFWAGTTVEQCIAVADSCSKNCLQKEVSHSFYQVSMKLSLSFTVLTSNLSIY